MSPHARNPTLSDASPRETHELIASDKVEGTCVYRSNGEKVGHIERIMLDKCSGKAAYALMKFGGFLGMGQDTYPLPWSVLTYNTSLGGYEVNVTDEQLRGAAKYARDTPREKGGTPREKGGENRDSAIYGYWGAPPYWL